MSSYATWGTEPGKPKYCDPRWYPPEGAVAASWPRVYATFKLSILLSSSSPCPFFILHVEQEKLSMTSVELLQNSRWSQGAQSITLRPSLPRVRCSSQARRYSISTNCEPFGCMVLLYYRWYQDAKAAATKHQRQQIIFTAPYTDADSGKLIMTAAAPLFFDATKGT